MRGLIHTVSIVDRGVKQLMVVSGSTGTLANGQTITGSLSTTTAKVISASSMTTETPSGSFTVGETVSTSTWSATFVSIGDWFDSYGETEYYSSTTSSTARLYRSKDSIKIAGEHMYLESRMFIMLPPAANISVNNQIVSTVEGYAGTWEVSSINPHYDSSGLHHYSCELAGVTP